MPKRAVAVGDNCIDVYVYPASCTFVGGNAVNVAVAMQRNGIQASYVGFVGNDAYGTLVVDSLQNEGVDVSRVRRVKGETAVTYVELRDGDRVFLEERLGVGADLTLDEDALTFISEHDLVHNTHLGHTHEYVEEFKRLGLIVSFDYSTLCDRELLDSTLEHVDIAFASLAEEDASKAESVAQALAESGPGIVVVTLGAAGSLAYDGNRVWRQPSRQIEVVDTLGAGDAFAGIFLSDWLKGKSMDEILIDATIGAAERCQHYGAWESRDTSMGQQGRRHA